MTSIQNDVHLNVHFVWQQLIMRRIEREKGCEAGEEGRVEKYNDDIKYFYLPNDPLHRQPIEKGRPKRRNSETKW